MVKILRITTNSGVRFCLRHLDRSIVDYYYFKGIQAARKHAEELGLTVIN